MDGGESYLWSTIGRAFAYGTPLLWTALGEIYAQRAGLVNLGLEGMMLCGALGSFAVAQTTGSIVCGILAAAAIGAALGGIHALASITLRANQYISGLAITMAGAGATSLLGRKWVGSTLAHPLGAVLFGQNALTYLALALAAASWFVFYRTRWGLAIRAAGENPAAVDAAGVNVFLVRYLAVIWGGALAGVAGAFLAVAYQPAWTEGMTVGMGWIALAIVIFAGWNPLKAVGAALIFGALYHLSFRLQAFLTPELLKTLPYVGVVLVLWLDAVLRQRSAAPAALGLPYLRGQR